MTTTGTTTTVRLTGEDLVKAEALAAARKRVEEERKAMRKANRANRKAQLAAAVAKAQAARPV